MNTKQYNRKAKQAKHNKHVKWIWNIQSRMLVYWIFFIPFVTTVWGSGNHSLHFL